MSSLSTKRPSFTWMPYQSPRKGLLTVLILLGSFSITFLPNSAHSIMAALGFHRTEAARLLHRISMLLAVAGFGTNPLLYGRVYPELDYPDTNAVNECQTMLWKNSDICDGIIRIPHLGRFKSG